MPSREDLRRENRLWSWKEGAAKTVTFIVTEDCQLRCKYCYLVGKNKTQRMDFEVARATVEYLLRTPQYYDSRSIVFDFIGGEPLIEIDLIDRICDYIKLRLYETDHPWFDSYRFSFSTNGLLYAKPKVQHFIAKNRTHISIGISLDGTKSKHDANRVFANGRGSYDRVVKAVPLWLRQFPEAQTKATISHDDLPFIKDSVLHLFSLGIRNVAINTVFEDVWKDGDDALFEQQLTALADAIIDADLWREHVCTLFTRNIGTPLDKNEDGNWCGAGKMLAVDGNGWFYPCNRFTGFSLHDKPGRIIGNCYDGIDPNKLRPFLALTRKTQTSGECSNCDVATGCAWCSGNNYDCSREGTLFDRATYICKMHKARVRANNYYWSKLQELRGPG